MMWNRLKNMKCPKCNKGIREFASFYMCNNRKCEFKINKEKFDRIVDGMYSKKLTKIKEEDNLSDLSDLKL